MAEKLERLQELAVKARAELEKILNVIGKEADLSSKFLKRKINILTLDTEIEKKYRELGKEAYDLISRGDITDPGLRKISDDIDKIYIRLGQTRKEISRLKEQMKKAVPKR